MTALLSPTAVKVRLEHGGGLFPVVAGQLHMPAVERERGVTTPSKQEQNEILLYWSLVHLTLPSERS